MTGSTLIVAGLKSGDALGVLLASCPFVGTLLFNALLRVGNGNRSGELGCCLIEATVLRSALGDSRCRIVSLFIKAEGPARGAGSTLLLAVLKSRQTLGIRLASSVLVGTLLFDARERIGDGDHDRSGDNWCLNSLLEAIFLFTTLHNVGCSRRVLTSDTETPTTFALFALIGTCVKSRHAFGVKLASILLARAFIFHARDGSGERGCCLIDATVIRSTLGGVYRSLRSLSWKAEGPA